ncbi:beta-1,4-galactosyltransferase galt-1-like [Rana temporaria]|uniref:beta-1,4-galactosyltransferase galt-1-like n=1 Tax=Rana temporaria TaxID=8407 RepID=UPI001AAC888A|nr:beta-1,4-galactosyltransferase galt-1-like [Rana temporaria]
MIYSLPYAETVRVKWHREGNVSYLILQPGMKPCTSIKKLCKVFSLLFSTFTVLYLIYIVVLMKIALPSSTSTFPLLRWTESEEPVCKHNVTRDTIIKVKNSRTYLIAAYLDLQSGRTIRILGITNRYEQDVLLCDFCLSGTNNTTFVEFQIHADHFDFPYGTTDLLCKLPDERIPDYISIYQMDEPSQTYLKIQNTKKHDHGIPITFRYDFLVCVSTMFGSYNNILQFIQSMEMYQILGAKKVVIYHTDSSLLMKKVLSYYKKLKLVELVPWPITSFLNVSTGWHYPEHPGDLHYYGQTAALNDCIYRNRYRTKYIALTDIDELILPIMHKDWPEMIDSLLRIDSATSVFIFENHVFPTTLQDKTNSLTPPEWASIPGLNILQHVYREPNRPSEINPTKMILNPRNVVQTSVHVPLEFVGEQYEVSGDIAKLCHYREPKQKDLVKDNLIKDTIMSKYETVLVQRVNRLLSKLRLMKKRTAKDQ